MKCHSHIRNLTFHCCKQACLLKNLGMLSVPAGLRVNRFFSLVHFILACSRVVVAD